MYINFESIPPPNEEWVQGRGMQIGWQKAHSEVYGGGLWWWVVIHGVSLLIGGRRTWAAYEGRVTWSLASDQRFKDVWIVRLVSSRYSLIVFWAKDLVMPVGRWWRWNKLYPNFGKAWDWNWGLYPGCLASTSQDYSFQLYMGVVMCFFKEAVEVYLCH